MASNRPSLARNRAQASYDVSAEQVDFSLKFRLLFGCVC